MIYQVGTPDAPYRSDPRYDMDIASYGLVKPIWEQPYDPGNWHWERKQAFYTVADQFGRVRHGRTAPVARRGPVVQSRRESPPGPRVNGGSMGTNSFRLLAAGCLPRAAQPVDNLAHDGGPVPTRFGAIVWSGACPWDFWPIPRAVRRLVRE